MLNCVVLFFTKIYLWYLIHYLTHTSLKAKRFAFKNAQTSDEMLMWCC